MSQLKTIATFLTPEDANLARCILDGEGISSYLECETTIGMVWWWSNAAGGVKLQVAEADEQRAREILAEDSAPENTSEAVRICSHCGEEIPQGFDICWSCESPVNDDVSATSVKAAVLPASQGREREDEAEYPNDENAARAFRAAVFGIAICPPLVSFYSAWLLLKIALENQPLSEKGKKQYHKAMIVNLIVCVLCGWFFIRLL